MSEISSCFSSSDTSLLVFVCTSAVFDFFQFFLHSIKFTVSEMQLENPSEEIKA